MARRRDRLLSRRQLALAGTLLVVAVGAVVAAWTVDLGTVVAAVRGANPVLLGVAVGVYACSWPLRGHRYDEILGVMGHRCGLAFLTAAVFLSQTANVVLPARAGDGARAYVLNARRQVPYATGAASLALERLFDLVAIAVLGTVALAALLVTGDTGSLEGPVLPAAAAVGLLAGLALAALVALARSDRRLGPALRARVPGVSGREESTRPRLDSLVDGAVRFGVNLRAVAADGRALVTVGAGSLALWALDVLTAVLVLGAIETGLSLSALLAAGTLAVSVGNLAKVIPLSQGGIGLYEAAFTGVVVAVTPAGAAIALAAALLDHALKNAVTLAGGALAAVWLNVSPTAVASEG
jgi:uncharacterized protein (TIRG00374 family)